VVKHSAVLPIPTTMRAAVYRGPNQMRTETLPVPKIGPRELLVKVAVCGVCPTDLKKIKYGTVPPPRVFGHETAGTIVKIGKLVRGFKVGERVALHHHVPCLDCHFCRHRAFAQCQQYKRTGITAGFEPAGGGFAEFVRVMDFVLPGVVKIPDRNSFEEGAMLEPVNTVLKAVKRLSLQRGDAVLVAGQGPIGLMFTGLLDLQGFNVIATDLLESRLRLARKFGAHSVFKAHATRYYFPTDSSKSRTGSPQLPQPIHRATRGRGLDAAILAVPSDDALRQALHWVRGAGQVLLFAHTRRGAMSEVDLASVCVDEKDLIGSYSADFMLQREVARIIFSRQLDVRPLITHSFPLEKISAAIALAERPTAASLKIVVRTEA
jgi:L-iditol 2-dehydrogenase